MDKEERKRKAIAVADAEHEKAWDRYEKAFVEYKKAKTFADAEYDKATSADAEYDKAVSKIRKE